MNFKGPSRRPSRRGDEKRDADILVVEVERMAVVAVVLTEGFAVIAENNPQRLPVEASCLESLHQRAERRVAVMDGITIPPELVAVRKGAGLGRLVRMMAGNRQIRHEKTLIHRQRVNPAQNASDGRGLVHTEAGVVLTADVARIH